MLSIYQPRIRKYYRLRVIVTPLMLFYLSNKILYQPDSHSPIVDIVFHQFGRLGRCQSH